jgi:NADPH:quinone reductase-like Zn-dependent oxidoreductase
MKAMEVSGAWGLENIKPVSRPAPTAGPGEIVIEMKAVSVNPRDSVVVTGGYGKLANLPLVPLCDGAGIVVELGPGVSGFSEGDLVCPTYSRTWLHGTISRESYPGALGMAVDGTAQELFLTPAEAVVRAPKNLAAREAATLPCAGVTAWNAVVEQTQVRADDRVLIQGTGGVSLFALQFAKMHGAEVIVISSSDEKLDRVRKLGADHTINYTSTPDWEKIVRDITDGQGVDNIVEVGGVGTLAKSLSCVAPSGTISVIGILSGIAGEINLGPMVTRNIRLQGITVGSRDMFRSMVLAMERHQTQPIIDNKGFAFDELGAALASLPEGRHFGKVVCELEN